MDEVTKTNEELFVKEQSFFDAIKKAGSFQVYVLGLEGRGSLYECIDRVCRCIDEGTPGGIHLGGSGILLDQTKAAEILRSAGVEAITSHEGCGAAAIAGKNAVSWSRSLAASMRIDYEGHIASEDMNRPSRIHDARVTYYDNGTGFDYSQINGVPKGFTISRKYLPADYGEKELELTIDIAFGEHGMGELFTRKNPFQIVVIDGSEEVLAEAVRVAKKYPERIIVDVLRSDK